MSALEDILKKSTTDPSTRAGYIAEGVNPDTLDAQWKAMHPGGLGRILAHAPVLGTGMGIAGLAAAGAAAGGDPNAGTGVPLDQGAPPGLQSLYDMYLGEQSPSSPIATTGAGGGGVLKNILSFVGKNPLQAAQIGLAGLNAIQANKLKSQQFRLMNEGLGRVNRAADATAPSLNLRAPGSVQAMVGGRP